MKDQYIEKMECYAKENGIPIMEKEGIDFLCTFIKEHQCKRILEIGAAIGYSAIRMALCGEDIEVVSVERDDERYEKAIANIQAMGLENRIHIHHGDALEWEVEGMFDLLFIDAAKAQYTKFFERYESHLCENGYVISDNLQFHGFVEHPETIRSRHLRQMVRKIKNYIQYLEARQDYDTQFLQLGDGVAISQKKPQNNEVPS